MLVKARSVQQYLRNIVKAHNKENLAVRWHMPTKFPVFMENRKPYVKRMESKMNSIGMFGAARIRVSVALGDSKDLNKPKQLESISANLIQSLDAAHLARSIVKCNKAGITHFAMIHDSFGTHVADKGTMDRLLREAFIEVHEEFNELGGISNRLYGLHIRDVAGGGEGMSFPDMYEVGNLDLRDVLNSPYFFS